MTIWQWRKKNFWAVALLSILAIPAIAQTQDRRIEQLEAQSREMAKELKKLRAEIANKPSPGTPSNNESLKSEVVKATQSAQRAEKAASEWKTTTALAHLAGYGSVGYTGRERGTDAFDVVTFNPFSIFSMATGYCGSPRSKWNSKTRVTPPWHWSTALSIFF